MHSPVSASRRQRLTQGVSKEVPADYSADYVGIGATGSQKLDIRGRLQGVSVDLKSRHAARTSTAHSRQTKESGYRGSTEQTPTAGRPGQSKADHDRNCPGPSSEGAG